MKTILMIFGILSLLLLAACTTEKIIVTNDQATKDLNKISVLGNAEIKIAPDQAEIMLSVVTEDKDVKKAQQKNAELATQVINALRAKGVSEKEIETLNYGIEKIQEWENDKYVHKGYRVRNTIKVTTSKLDKVGDFIDVAVNAGANDVDGVTFSLTKEAKQKVSEQLLTKASEDAESKANILTKALGVRLGKAVTISEYNYDISPVYYSGRDFMMESAAPTKASTPIQPKNVETSARITVVFNLE